MSIAYSRVTPRAGRYFGTRVSERTRESLVRTGEGAVRQLFRIIFRNSSGASHNAPSMLLEAAQLGFFREKFSRPQPSSRRRENKRHSPPSAFRALIPLGTRGTKQKAEQNPDSVTNAFRQ